MLLLPMLELDLADVGIHVRSYSKLLSTHRLKLPRQSRRHHAKSSIFSWQCLHLVARRRRPVTSLVRISGTFGAKDVAKLQAKDSVMYVLAMHTGATRAVRRATESLRGVYDCGAFD
jgi:hypothetical protein